MKNIDHFLWPQFVVKYVRALFLMVCLNTSKKKYTHSSHQLGIIPGNSCVQQLMSITLCLALFLIWSASWVLDILKVLIEFWHDELLLKFKNSDINGHLLVVKKYLWGRYQWVVINGQISDWSRIKAGVSSRVYKSTTIFSYLYIWHSFLTPLFN